MLHILLYETFYRSFSTGERAALRALKTRWCLVKRRDNNQALVPGTIENRDSSLQEGVSWDLCFRDDIFQARAFYLDEDLPEKFVLPHGEFAFEHKVEEGDIDIENSFSHD